MIQIANDWWDVRFEFGSANISASNEEIARQKAEKMGLGEIKSIKRFCNKREGENNEERNPTWKGQ